MGDPPGRELTDEPLRAQVAALEDRLERIVASVPGVVCSYKLRPDGSACMPFASAAATDLYGITPEALARDVAPMFANVEPADLSRVVEAIAQAGRTMSPWHDAFRYRHPTKGLRWIEGWSVPEREPDGSIVWFGFVMDVTERKTAQLERERLIVALQETDRLRAEFLGVLSHELRNPLAPIRNAIHLLDRVPGDGPQAARAKEVIRRQTEHLRRLVDDLLDVTRISRGKIELHRAGVDARELVRRTCDDLRSVFEQADVALRLDLGAGPVWIDADATRISQAVGNLLQNAVKFTPAGGIVTVAVTARGGRAEVCVRDSGVGMDPDQIERMFEPFAQGRQALARTAGGLGLGLPLVRGLVELHGGEVRARSEGPGRGTEFTIDLPLGQAPRPTAQAIPVAAASPAGRLVLVVEDHVDTARTLAEVLELEGHRVHVARDGRSGIRMARELLPDVVLCDIGLPDMDGYEVARALRSDDRLRSTRLVALSGYAQPEDRALAMDAGFDAHLPKPSPLDELTRLVGESSRRSRTP